MSYTLPPLSKKGEESLREWRRMMWEKMPAWHKAKLAKLAADEQTAAELEAVRLKLAKLSAAELAAVRLEAVRLASVLAAAAQVKLRRKRIKIAA